MGLPQPAPWKDEYLDSAKRHDQEKLLKAREEIHQTILDNTDAKLLQHITEEALMDRIRATTTGIARSIIWR